MGQFCKKCGKPLRDAAKFCPSCGQKVEEADEKKTMVIGIIAVIAVVLAGVGIKNVATSIPDYEKPLRYEIDGINKKHIKKPF